MCKFIFLQYLQAMKGTLLVHMLEASYWECVTQTCITIVLILSECCIILLEMSCWAFVLYERVCAITLYIIACIHESRKYFLFMFFVKFRETTGVFRMHWPNLCVKYFHVTRFMRVLSIKLFFHICYFLSLFCMPRTLSSQ